MRRLLLIIALCLWPIPASAQTNAAGVQSLFDQGVAAARAGKHGEAVQALYQALETLRRQGRWDSVDAGLIALRLAASLEAIGNAQTDEAYEFAAATLLRANDPAPFVQAAEALIRRRVAAGKAEAAAAMVEAMLGRTAQAGVDEDLRIDAVRTAIDYYARTGQSDLKQKAFETLADLKGEGAQLSGWRGLILLQRAQNAQSAGRLDAARSQLVRAIADLRRADDQQTLPVALMLLGRMDFIDGAYRSALPVFEEAEALLRERIERADIWIEATSYRARLLERLDRTREAAEVAADTAQRLAQRKGADSLQASAARLDLAHFLLRAERSDEARALLKAEAERMGGSADPLIAAIFHDKLAGIRLADLDFDGAREAAAESLRLFNKHRPDEPSWRLEPARKLADAMAARDDHAATERAMRDMIEITERVFAPSHPEVARDLNTLALFLRARDRLPEAESVQRRVADIVRTAYGETSQKYAYTLVNLAVTLTATDRAAAAVPLFRRAVELLATPGAEKDRIGVLASLAGAQRAMGQPREALKSLDAAIEISKTTPNLDVTYEMGLLIDGNAILALYDLGADDEAWRIAQNLFARKGKASASDAANFNNLLLVSALVASSRGHADEALALVRQAGEAARAIGQTDRRFVDEWAGLLARYAWQLSR